MRLPLHHPNKTSAARGTKNSVEQRGTAWKGRVGKLVYEFYTYVEAFRHHYAATAEKNHIYYMKERAV